MIKDQDEYRNLMSLAETQTRFIEKYRELITDERDRFYFQTELLHIIHLIYREAQQPLVKQLSDFILQQNKPVILDKI